MAGAGERTDRGQDFSLVKVRSQLGRNDRINGSGHANYHIKEKSQPPQSTIASWLHDVTGRASGLSKVDVTPNPAANLPSVKRCMDDQQSRQALSQAFGVILASIVEDQAQAAADPGETIHDLEGRRLAVGAAIDSFQSMARHHLALLSRRHNSLIPLSKFPAEILEAIILHATKGTRKPVSDLHTFAKVSHIWWITIKSSPQLWAQTVTNIEGTAALELSLRKSGSIPLHYMHNRGLPLCSSGPRSDLHSRTTVLEALAVTTPDPDFSLSSFTRLVEYRVKSYATGVGASARFTVWVRLPNTTMSYLESLEVHACTCVYSWPGEDFTLPVLRRIVLRNVALRNEERFLDFLRCAPNVETLYISTPDDYEYDETAITHRVSLQRLRRLHLSGVTIDFGWWLLENVDFNSDLMTEVTVLAEDSARDGDEWRGSPKVRRIWAQLLERPSLRSGAGGGIALALSHCQVGLTASSPDLTLRLSIVTHPGGALGAVLPILVPEERMSQPELPDLTVTVHHERVFRSLPTLTTMTSLKYGFQSHGFDLSGGAIAGVLPLVYRLPRLREVWVGDNDWKNWCIGVLNGRFLPDGAPIWRNKVEKPVVFKTLEGDVRVTPPPAGEQDHP